MLPKSELERYCELVAALKLRTTNKPQGVLTRSTINEYLTRWHFDQTRLCRQPPAVRFQAERSDDCWQFDMSPSDLKHIATPPWVDPSKGEPTLMLYSVVDDRSGVCYLEYRCVYGEDAESALRFLFNAMAPLQVQLHLTLALEAGYKTGEKPVTAELVESVLSRQLDDLEPTLTRHGYHLKDMVERFDAKPAEIRALFSNQLEPTRAAELRDRILTVGLPIEQPSRSRVLMSICNIISCRYFWFAEMECRSAWINAGSFAVNAGLRVMDRCSYSWLIIASNAGWASFKCRLFQIAAAALSPVARLRELEQMARLDLGCMWVPAPPQIA